MEIAYTSHKFNSLFCLCDEVLRNFSWYLYIFNIIFFPIFHESCTLVRTFIQNYEWIFLSLIKTIRSCITWLKFSSNEQHGDDKYSTRQLSQPVCWRSKMEKSFLSIKCASLKLMVSMLNVCYTLVQTCSQFSHFFRWNVNYRRHNQAK